MVVPSQGTMLFIEIEKAGTKGCFKITWLMSRHTAQIYFVGGSCTFTYDTYINLLFLLILTGLLLHHSLPLGLPLVFTLQLVPIVY